MTPPRDDDAVAVMDCYDIWVDLRDGRQDLAFARAEGEVEGLHAAVYALGTNFRAALYRDFPDPERGVAPA